MEIEIIIDDLNKKVYQFYQDGMRFRLNYYSEKHRQTKRHGWKSIKYYDRLRQRDCTIKVDEIPLTDELIQIVKERAINSVQVTK